MTLFLRAREIFLEAIARPQGEQVEFLDRACAEPELRAEVESLLRHDLEGDDLLPIAGLHRPGEETNGSSRWLGRTVGNYRLLKEIGRGGSGTVFLAERSDQTYEKRVAIKLLRGLGSEEGRRAFESERRILASLDHPNIARLLDAGAVDGTPYVVIELVEGLPITASCDRRRLSIRERVELFVLVCEAVQLAHRHLVVHRDLKPGNILVDESNVPKLLDFGIARHLDPGGSEMTVTRERRLTPAYASPEQLAGEPVTTVSDVYSLGLVLYELLAGCRPFAREGLPLGQLLERMALPPVPPSERVEGREGLASDRRLTASSALRQQLRGDLDAVVEKALRVSPDERYVGARELAGDLGRWLRGEPILARPPRALYRLGKLVRRNRLTSAAILAALVSLTTLAAGMTVQSWRLERSWRVAEQERDRAREVSGLLTDAFSMVDPESGGDRETTAREVLDRSRERLRELQVDPATKATLLRTLALAYRGLGVYPAAVEGLRETADLLRSEGGVELAISLRELAATLLLEGELEEAEALSREAIGLLESGSGTELELAAAWTTLAGVFREQARYEEAEASLQQAIAWTDRLPTVDARARAEALSSLGNVLRLRGRAVEAEPILREALALIDGTSQLDDLERSSIRHNLAIVLGNQNRFAESELLYRKVIGTRRDILGETHPRLASTIGQMAAMLTRAGRYVDAETAYREALAAVEAARDQGSPRHGSMLNNLSLLLTDAGRYEEAERVFEEVLPLARELFGDEHPNIAVVLNNYGLMLRAQGQFTPAEETIREALALCLRVLPPEHPNIGQAWNNLGLVLLETGRYPEAEESFRRALALQRKAHGETHLRVSITVQNLGLVLARSGRLAEAEAAFREAIAIQREVAIEHPELANTLANLANHLVDQGRIEDAEPLAAESLAMREKLLGAQHPRFAASLSQRADLLIRSGRFQEAASLVDRASAIFAEALPGGHWRIHEARSLAGAADAGLGRIEEAEDQLREGYLELQKLGHRQDAAERARQRLVEFYRDLGLEEKASRYPPTAG